MSAPSNRDDDRHIPVLLAEVLDALAAADGERFIDGTFGAGGYTRAILEAAATYVLAIDRDPDALAEGQPLVATSGGRLTLAAGVFGDMQALAEAAGFTSVDGVVLDIGVSSMQLDRADRGFSFMAEGPLDMRMSQSGRSAADVVNGCDEQELAHILRTLGEERQAGRIARAIVRAAVDHRGPGPGRAQGGGLSSRRAEGSGYAQLPGDPHSRERRAGRTARRSFRSRNPAGCRWAAGRGQLPQPGRPHREALPARP